jgi:hypothetical protein
MPNDVETTELQDVFGDAGAAEGENTSDDSTPETKASDEAASSDTGDANEGEGNQAGDKEASGTPPEGKDDLEMVTDAKGQKLIPEHRFKAALKSAEDRVRKELEEAANAPEPEAEPDKATDPEGHARHVRMKASVEVMREMKPDYQEVIDHYAKMAMDNPLLDQAVDGAPLPAKLAYDIAKKDLEIKDALALKNSDEYKEFTEWKKSKAPAPTKTENNLRNKVTNGLRAVPNLNRSTNATPNRNVRKSGDSQADDDLFAGAL